ncbi:MAG: hypothetical protein GY870_06350 [archaeon]|nr:hypothetical protein [archaeon]
MKTKDQLAFLEKSDNIENLKEELLKRNENWVAKKRDWMDYNNSLDTIILTCMDSRVPVEKIFDLNPGEALILRNAGNIITEDVFRSVLAGIFEIHVKNIIILGHTRCGMAIKDNKETISELIKRIPMKLKLKMEIDSREKLNKLFGFFDGGKWNENAVKNTIILSKKLKEVLNSEDLPEISTAIYDLDSGKVDFI